MQTVWQAMRQEHITKKCSRPYHRASIGVRWLISMFIYVVNLGLCGLAADFLPLGA